MKIISAFLLLLIAGCSANQPQPERNDLVENLKYQNILMEGFQRLSERDRKKAIDDHFNIVIQYCDNLYKDPGTKTYSSRGLTEALYYIFKAESENQNALILEQTCAEALYLKGYAILEFGRIEEAKKWIELALERSPVNSAYMSELGHIYHVQENWEKALETYRNAEKSAETYSPKEVRKSELARAIRGIGYSLIELGRLDEAEEAYRRCLEINKNDKGALGEIQYIQQLRLKNTNTSDI